MSSYSDIKKAIDENGLIKGIALWLLSNVLVIITALTSAYSAFYIHQTIVVNNQQFSENRNSAIASVVYDSKNNPIPSPILDTSGGPTPFPENNQSQLKTFSKNNWDVYDVSRFDSDGYYCPFGQPYPYWNIWTKRKYKIDYSPKVIVKLIDKTNDKKLPSISLSYGDKSNIKPDTIFRVNFFDGDHQSIRIYGSRDNPGELGRDSVQWSNEGEITLSLQPVRPNPQKPGFNLNPSIITMIEQQEHLFNAELSTLIPTARTENVDGYQYGIGITRGDCIKIISSNLE